MEIRDELLDKLFNTLTGVRILDGNPEQESTPFIDDKKSISPEKLVEKICILAENNERLWKVLNYSSNSIIVTGKDGKILHIDGVFEEGSGVSAKSLIGKPVIEMEERGIKPCVSAMALYEKCKRTVLQTSPKDNANWVCTGVPVFDRDGEIDMVVTNSINIDEISNIHTYLKEKKEKMLPGKAIMDEGELLYSSANMQKVLEMADSIKALDTTVLITGESGVGKGVVSRYIHQGSGKEKSKYVEINCSAIPDNLFESEFFGYESGAFSGAKEGGKPGLMEMAHKGTLVLDEIGDMPFHMQAKLLKALQDKQFTRVGGVKPVIVDVRIIASTNQDLNLLVEEGKFRADLYYRLNVFPIHIPPLRERKDDVDLLLTHYINHFKKKHRKNTIISYDTYQKLLNHTWPGNIRELEHAVERLIILHDGVADLKNIEPGHEKNKDGVPLETIQVNGIMPLSEALEETERKLFILASQNAKSSYEVAERLKTSQPNAYRKMKKYVIT